jgi:hypothetical protein
MSIKVYPIVCIAGPNNKWAPRYTLRALHYDTGTAVNVNYTERVPVRWRIISWMVSDISSRSQGHDRCLDLPNTDSPVICSYSCDSKLILFQTRKWTQQSDWTVYSHCFQLHFTADDSKAASCHNDESDIFLRSTASGTLLFHIYGLSASWWDNDTKLVVNSGHDGQATVFHGDSGDRIFAGSAHKDASWVAGTVAPMCILL